MSTWMLVIALSTGATPFVWPMSFDSQLACETQAAELMRATKEASERPYNWTRILYGACVRVTGR